MHSLLPDVGIIYEIAYSTASIRVKQEPLTQIEHELSNSDPTRSRSEAYDAPVAEAGIGRSSESKGDLVSLRLFDFMDIDASPLGVKQEPQDAQSHSSVAWPSKALWDVWARYQSRQQGSGDPGMH